jgi:methionyl-tRNA synthetase
MGNAKRKVLITGALPYSNGRLHVGHLAGAYIPADTFARYLRLTGANVRFICGSDDHGVAIMLTADKEKRTPAEVANFYRQKQNADFSGIGMSFDIYGGTSQSPHHVKTSQDFFLALHQKGYFEKQSSRQFYDDVKGVFLPDRYVKGTCGLCGAADQNGDQCESCGKVLDIDTLLNPVSVMSGSAAVVRETVHWFLDLSRFEEPVRRWLESAQMREHTRSYVSGLLSTGLVKRAMTRDISWGIPVPLTDPDARDKVLYVWFDAPIGYISFTKDYLTQNGGSEDEYSEWWKSPETELFHFIGEDNTIFHCVIWIAMLSAEGTFRLPSGVIVNQFLNIQFPGQEEEKISKSRGTAIWIEDFLASGGSVDSLRYYLTMIAPEKARTVYKPEDFFQRHNSELGNALGNFVNRVLSFTVKHFGPEFPQYDPSVVTDADRTFRLAMEQCFKAVTEAYENHQFKTAVELTMEFCRECNRYVDAQAPWRTRKETPEVTKVTLVYSMEAIRFLAVMLAPVMPGVSDKMLAAFEFAPTDPLWETAIDRIPAGTPLAVPAILFQKLEG